MTCPYCGQEMEQGMLECDGRRRLAWFSSTEEYRVVKLGKFNLVSALSTYKIEAFYCDPCKKMILDVGT